MDIKCLIDIYGCDPVPADVKSDRLPTAVKHPRDEEDNYDTIIRQRTVNNPDIRRPDKQAMEMSQYTQTTLKPNNPAISTRISTEFWKNQ